MALSNEQLGDLGEDWFQLQAKAAGITVTKPGTDNKGWDRFAEWTLTREELQGRDVPLDRDDREVKALVQIKTTTKQPGRRDVKLSNWKSLIEHPGPAFFAVLEVRAAPAGGVEVESLYLVHVGEELIARHIERLRELEHEAAIDSGALIGHEATDSCDAARSGSAPASSARETANAGDALYEEAELHKRKLSFRYSKADRVEAPTPAALRAALSAPLVEGPDLYAARKRRIRQRVGYEDNQVPVFVKVTSTIPSGYDGDAAGHFADALLGTSVLEIVRGEVSDIRFGISSVPRALPEGTRIELETPKIPVRLRLRRSGSHLDRLALDAKMQDARVPTEDGTRGKVHFLLSHGSMTFSLLEPGIEFGYRLHVPGETEGRLNEISSTFQLATYLRDAFKNGESVQIERRGESESSWKHFYTVRDEEKEIVDFVEEIEKQDSQLLIEAIENARRLAQRADLPASLRVVPADVAAHRSQLALFEALRAAERGNSVSHALYFGIYGEKVNEEIQACLDQPQVGMAELASLRLGSHIIVIAFAAAGAPMLICSTVGDEHHTLTSETVSESEAEEFLRELGPDTRGYKLPLERVDFLKCYVFDAEDELPSEAALKEEALGTARSLYAGTLTRGEKGLRLSVKRSEFDVGG